MKQKTDSEINGAIDYLRLISAIGIVWFHTSAPGKELAYSALPCFIAILALYGIKPSSLVEAMYRRADRLLKPWLVWSLIYAIANVALSLKHGEPPLDWFEWQMLAYGPWIHLWFLPFAFISSTALAPMFLMTANSAAMRNLGLIGTLTVSLALVLLAPDDAHTPFPQWIFGAGTLGICLPLFFSTGPRNVRVALSAVSGLAIMAWYLFVSENDATAIGLGVFSVLVANRLRIDSSWASAACSKLSLHIYLVHPFLITFGYWLELEGTVLGIISVMLSVITAALIEIATYKARRMFSHQTNR